ncbi:MAG TPA: CHAT domain-containing protein [Pyrinomonadaceae bacterium]|nr:CHAT domain-containing protein [Pyrinomonadaceae bacterium]
MREPLRILMLAANPIDRNKLALTKEYQLLRNKMFDNTEAGSCDLRMEWAVQAESLKQALRENRPHIVHFSGHGHDEIICLEDDERKSRALSKRELGMLFNQSRSQIRVIVLNACYSARQAEHLSELVDFVIGTTVPIADAAALRFTNEFYRAIAIGGTVREAFNKAKKVTDDRREQYELLVRPGADETTPLLPPATATTIRLKVGNLKVNDELNIGRRIFEGFNPVDLPEPNSNEKTDLEIEANDISAGKANVTANDIWKQAK